MLVFSSYIACPPSAGRPRGNAIDSVKPFLIRPTKIIRHRLTKMIAVGERLARNVSYAGIDGFHLNTGMPVTARTLKFATEFRFEQVVDFLCFRSSNSFVDVFARFAQKTYALVSRPGPHACKSAVDQAHGSKTIHCRVNPAIEGN